MTTYYVPFPPSGVPTPQWTFSFALLAVVYLLLVILSGMSRRTLLWLGVSLVVGAALRIAFAPATLMDMSNYEREPIVFRAMLEGGIPMDWIFPAGSDRWQQILAFDLVVSCFLGLLVFVHAQVCFHNERVSLWSAILFSVCTVPIYFAHSDNLFISSAALSSLTFILLHRAMSSVNIVEEVFLGLAALVAFSVTLAARQENFIFGGLSVAAGIWGLAMRERSWWRKWIWAAALTWLAMQHFAALIESAGQRVSGPLDLARGVATLWTTPLSGLIWHNNYLKPWIVPLWYSLLALGGFVWTWRFNRRAAAYLSCWFAIFYVGHGVVFAWDDTATARYGMHSIIPVTFFAAFGAVQLIDFARTWSPAVRRPLMAAGAVGVVATTIWGLGLFRQPESDIQEEYRFLRELTARGIPESNALVVENYGHYDKMTVGDGLLALKAVDRFDYFGVREVNGRRVQQIEISKEIKPHNGPVYLYIGLPCLWIRMNLPISSFCANALASGSWELVAEKEIKSRRHDVANGAPVGGGRIALYRLRRESPGVSGVQ